MAAHTGISLEQYLSTSFEGVDREYVDGVVVERGMPSFAHGVIQQFFGVFFALKFHLWALVSSSEARVRLASGNVRIPDLAVYRCAVGEENYLLPELAVEIVSPDDSYSDVWTKCLEYVGSGIVDVWIVDPRSRRCWSFEEGTARETTTLRMTNHPVVLDTAELFAFLEARGL